MFWRISDVNAFLLMNNRPEGVRADLGCVALLSGYRGYVSFNF